MVQAVFTETDAEALFDDRERDKRFRHFWHPNGSLHWGYFDDLNNVKAEDFVPACDRWDRYMLAHSGIQTDSNVLEVACGKGNASLWIAKQTGCAVTGIDLSGSSIDIAKNKAAEYPDLQVKFQKESATNLPFADHSFTHAWSQAALYHIYQRKHALAEVYRVLEAGGIFLFDDFTTPKPEISADARKYVYDRLLFEPTFNVDVYTHTLQELGFTILEHLDISQHLEKSYELVAESARHSHPDLSHAFTKTREAIANGELGWSFFVCKK